MPKKIPKSSWVKQAKEQIILGKTVQVRPLGGSMRGRIESGQLVTLQPTTFEHVKVGDIVFIKWKNNYLLHLIKEIKDKRVLIGNNLGKINGWISAKDILAKVTCIED
ncbi:hypothetical protein [Candidatus Uabimicrobium sp. HlEnr_7]|uniref:hypothetical protein n=1 Tax=Candidatus Uabimicrobium helgolandensis TaxID=3095367 RepID=UPI003557CF27